MPLTSRRGEISIGDIPNQLRALADRVEDGSYGLVTSMLVVVPRDHAYPRTLGWGKIDGAFEPIVQFELAREWHVKASAGLLIHESEQHALG